MYETRSKIILLLSLSLLLGACRNSPGASCAKPGLYVQAQSVAPLRIPGGLDAPDTRGALRVPDLNEPEAPRPAGTPCLDQPPRYAPNARLEAPPTEKQSKKRGKQVEPAPAPVPPPAPTTPAAP
jgi:uncharacterized lipoprotein